MAAAAASQVLGISLRVQQRRDDLPDVRGNCAIVCEKLVVQMHFAESTPGHTAIWPLARNIERATERHQYSLSAVRLFDGPMVRIDDGRGA